MSSVLEHEIGGNLNLFHARVTPKGSRINHLIFSLGWEMWLLHWHKHWGWGQSISFSVYVMTICWANHWASPPCSSLFSLLSGCLIKPRSTRVPFGHTFSHQCYIHEPLLDLSRPLPLCTPTWDPYRSLLLWESILPEDKMLVSASVEPQNLQET
jgi:hypothetical protein